MGLVVGGNANHGSIVREEFRRVGNEDRDAVFSGESSNVGSNLKVGDDTSPKDNLFGLVGENGFFQFDKNGLGDCFNEGSGEVLCFLAVKTIKFFELVHAGSFKSGEGEVEVGAVAHWDGEVVFGLTFFG